MPCWLDTVSCKRLEPKSTTTSLPVVPQSEPASYKVLLAGSLGSCLTRDFCKRRVGPRMKLTLWS